MKETMQNQRAKKKRVNAKNLATHPTQLRSFNSK